MDRYEATLRLWKESRLTGPSHHQLDFFRRIRDRFSALPEDIDLGQTVEVVLRLKNWLTGLNPEGALQLVARAIEQGHEPYRLEEALKFIVQSSGGFSRVNLGEFIFRYTLTQIRAGKALWDTLPPPDRNIIQVETLLAAGLEEHPDVVALVLQEFQTLQGMGLKLAALLKDCASPQVAFELWRALRRSGPLVPADLDLLAQAVDAVGHRPETLDETCPVMGDDEDGHVLLSALN